jgi:uncharacterized FlaG/YvyC family protein
VKIYSAQDLVRFIPSGDRDATGDAYQKDEKRKSKKKPFQSYLDQESKELEIIEVTDERLDQAVEAFQKDAQAKQQGIEVERAPGLNIVLKDISGSVIRQFTGEEFLRLRDAIRDGRTSGKILDKKA